MQNQEKSSKLEKMLFGATRILAILGSLIAIASIVLIVQKSMDFNDGSHISFNEINAESSAQNGSVAAASAAPITPLITPDNVKKYLSGDNEVILKNWLNDLPTAEAKQDFINNLSEVITAAEVKNAVVINVINNYKTLKFSKVQKNGIEQYAEVGKKAAIYCAIAVLVIFVTLMSLVLVMLAIERNTRYAQQN